MKELMNDSLNRKKIKKLKKMNPNKLFLVVRKNKT